MAIIIRGDRPRHTIALRILTVAASFLLSGCAVATSVMDYFSDKPDFGEPVALEKFDDEVEISRVWKAQVGDGLSKHLMEIAPVVVADRVYTADAYGLVEARDRFTGDRIWRTRIGDPNKKPVWRFFERFETAFVSGGLGAGGGRIFVGTTRGDLIALDAADGTELWRIQLSSEVLTPAAADDGIVVAHTIDGQIVALNAETGSTIWNYDTQVPLLSLRGTATPMIQAGRVYAGFANGMVVTVDLVSGRPLWEQRIMLPSGRSDLERMVDVDGTPIMGQGFLYAASFQGMLKALRLQDGAVLWEREMSTHRDLAIGLGQIYVVNEDDVVMAINQRDATLEWEQEGLKYRKLTSPVAFGNYLILGDSEGFLHVLAQSDGRFLGRYKLRDGIRSAMLEVDDVLFTLANDGTIEALEFELRDS